MKPESQISQPTPEQALVKTLPAVELSPDIKVVEGGVEKSVETFEQRADLSAIANDVAVTTVPVTTVINDDSVVSNTTLISNPIIASDDDLIEKEWVDRAKKIVAETHNDPHKREQEVSKLQSDYIKKRYGRELGVTE